MTWQNICTLDDIIPNGGVCALVVNEQVAIFRIPSNEGDEIYAISNYDPFSNANVISRGLVGCNKGEITVASPIYKNVFCLSNGRCLDDETVILKTWKVQLKGNSILIHSGQAESTQTQAV